MPQNLVQRLFTIKTESHHTCYISPKYLLSQCLVQYILLSTWDRCNSAYSSSSSDVTVCGLPLLFTPVHACNIRTVEQLKGRSNVCGVRRLVQFCHISEFFNRLYLHYVKVWSISSQCICPNSNQWDQRTYCWNYSFACESTLSLGAKLILQFSILSVHSLKHTIVIPYSTVTI